MQDGVCSQCGSTEVYRGIAGEGEGLTAGTYTASVELSAGSARMTLDVDTYICGACGRVEMRVANRDDLWILQQADGWVKVSPSALPDRSRDERADQGGQ